MSATVESAYSTISSSATVDCTATTLSLGDAISIDMGYSDNHQVEFTGFVKKIVSQRADGIVTIHANDTLVRAVDYFIASDTPDAPFQRNNISSLNLVKDLLALAGLNTVSGTEPGFTWGTNADGARFNLQSVSDAVMFVASIVGYTIYASGGTVYFVARKPYVTGGDSSAHTYTTGNGQDMLDIQYEESSEKIRNKIVCYGRGDLHASASASSPYVIVDQTTVIAHELLDTQELVQGTCDVNLDLLNRLGRTVTFSAQGVPGITARSIIHITESFTGLNDDAFCYKVSKLISSGGYIDNITATL